VPSSRWKRKAKSALRESAVLFPWRI